MQGFVYFYCKKTFILVARNRDRGLNRPHGKAEDAKRTGMVKI